MRIPEDIKTKLKRVALEDGILTMPPPIYLTALPIRCTSDCLLIGINTSGQELTRLAHRAKETA